MTRLLISVLILFGSFSIAQSLHIGEVELETDPFTSAVSCSQIVVTTDFSFAIALYSEPQRIELVAAFQSDDSIYNGTSIASKDRILFKLGDDVHTYALSAADSDYSQDLEYASIRPDRTFLAGFLSSPEDVLVRFESDYSGRRFDTSVPHNMIVALAQGFGQSCLD